MTTATCTPTTQLVPAWEREHKPDRLGELLECLAGLLVETARQKAGIAQLPAGGDPRAAEAVARLIDLERNLREVSVEAATVHQLLMRTRVI